MINDSIKVTGTLSIVLKNNTGKVKDTRKINNVITTVGKNYIADQLLVSPTSAKMSHMAVGSGLTPDPAVITDTALTTELARVSLASTVTNGASVVTYTASFGAGTGTGAITEAGIFNDVTAGTMLARTVFAVINKGATDSLTITWDVTVG